MEFPPKKSYSPGILPIVFMAAALVIWKDGGINANGWGDYVMLGVLALLLIWFLSPRRPDKSAGHDGPAE